MTARAGFRPLIAQTCTDCGELRESRYYHRNGRGYYHRQCDRCRSRRRWAAADDAKRQSISRKNNNRLRRLHAATRPQAARHKQDWTAADVDLALSTTDVVSAAEQLGRTYDAVVKARTRYNSTVDAP